ncbi:MAG TPA: lysine--tRNA ligase [Planctomycetota bacterium]|nr:lysine--tRNA ligase [Planctomycetota bacterium]
MALLEDLESLRAAAQAAFSAAGDAAALEAARVEYLGTRGKLKATLGRMGEVPKEQKPAVGKRANEIGKEIEAFFEQARERVSREGASSGTAGQASSGTHGESHSSLEQLKAERLQKLKAYEAKAGPGSAWGTRFPERTSGKALTSVEGIRKIFAGLKPEQHTDAQASQHEVCLAARVVLRRDQSKKLIFMTVQDQTGTIQVALWNALLNEEQLALLRDTLDLWDIVGITGKLAFTQKGEPTVWATSARILTKCILPPPDKHHGIHDKEIRYRQRYLDLISEEQSRKTFILRAKVVAGVRRFLDDQGFLEMETPILQTIPGGAAARPFETHLNSLNMKMYLRIATEIPLKKLLVGGLEKVYDLGRIFRNEGLSPKHNPEFTTVEIYQSYGDLRDMMALTENLVSGLAEKLTGSTTVTFRGKQVKLGAPWPRLDYCELLKKHAGVTHDDVPGLEKKIRELGLDPSGMSHVDKIDTVFGEICEPHLQDACFVINQPVEMSPLCKAHPDNPKLADRFEAFASSMEIANAYTELNDPIEQRKRLNDQANEAGVNSLKNLNAAGLADIAKLDVNDSEWVAKAKKAIENLPSNDKRRGKLQELAKNVHDVDQRVDEDFLCAMEHGMPPAGGLGIGIDRVVMLLAGADSIRDVILFPLMRPEGGKTEGV